MEDKQPDTNWQFKPGDTIQPGDATTPAQTPATASAEPTPLQAQQPVADTSTPAESGPVPDAQTGAQITWTASEFIDHAKSADWYLALAVVAVVMAAGIYLLFRDLITSIVILVAAVAFGSYGRRQPRQLEYALDMQGLSIAGKFFPYNLFRSFAVIDEDHFASIALLPLKRFGFLTTVYFDPSDEDAIIDIISQHLPLEPRNSDLMDRFLKRIRF